MASNSLYIPTSLHEVDENHDCIVLLCNNQHQNAFPNLLALGKSEELINKPLEDLDNFLDKHKSVPVLGFLNYNLKNNFEKLTTRKPQTIPFADSFFFVPQQVFKGDNLSIFHHDDLTPKKTQSLAVKCRTSREEYLSNVEKIKQHILDGDVYEINYCIEFYDEEVTIDPVGTFQELMNYSPTPFAVFLKHDGKYMLGASPERFIQRQGCKVTSQPIKGTSRRHADPEQDEASKKQLQNSKKEQAENLMIVDLVRNDLARSCKLGTIKVEKLFEVQSFKQVHQLVSTISAEVEEETPISSILKNAFPMGSMTGAPKIKAMELIDNYEDQARGLFSGSVGIIHENRDFDFNVVIRSIFYDQNSQKLAYSVGSAITLDSDPEQEYEECLLKAEAIQKILAGN